MQTEEKELIEDRKRPTVDEIIEFVNKLADAIGWNEEDKEDEPVEIIDNGDEILIDIRYIDICLSKKELAIFKRTKKVRTKKKYLKKESRRFREKESRRFRGETDEQ